MSTCLCVLHGYVSTYLPVLRVYVSMWLWVWYEYLCLRAYLFYVPMCLCTFAKLCAYMDVSLCFRCLQVYLSSCSTCVHTCVLDYLRYVVKKIPHITIKQCYSGNPSAIFHSLIFNFTENSKTLQRNANSTNYSRMDQVKFVRGNL